MKKRSKTLLWLFALGAVATGLGIGVRWYSGHTTIRYHNQCLRLAQDAALRIDVTSIGTDIEPVTIINKPSRKVTVTDRAEISQLLQKFRLPWYTLDPGVGHECAGNLRIRIVMPDAHDYHFQYDHGVGIYPIHDGNRYSGFVYLPPGNCAFLNQYFRSLGYDADEIGRNP